MRRDLACCVSRRWDRRGGQDVDDGLRLRSLFLLRLAVIILAASIRSARAVPEIQHARGRSTHLADAALPQPYLVESGNPWPHRVRTMGHA